MKNQIIELRNRGKSYDEIAKIIDCSKSTVSYYLDSTQKEKSRLRTKNNRAKNPHRRKLENFRNRKHKVGLRNKIARFHDMSSTNTYNFRIEDVLNKYQSKPYCYLTGLILDLNNPASYSFDHILPASRGGKNTLENLGLSTKEANQAKADKTPEEFIALCKKVLEHNGYTISN